MKPHAPRRIPPNAVPAPMNARRWIVVYVICLAASVAAFSPTLFDPGAGLMSGPGTPLSASLVSHVKHVGAIFGGDFMLSTEGQYRPMSYALLATMRTVIPADWTPLWQAWVLAFHALAATFVYAIARRLATTHAAALVACGVFLLHPLVAVFGNDIGVFHQVLGAAIFLGAWYLYLRFEETGRRSLYAAMLPLFLAGLFTTRAVATLPVVLAIDEFARRRERPLTVALRLAPFAALVVLMIPFWTTFRPNPMNYDYLVYSEGVAWYSFASSTAAAPRIAAGFLGGWGIPAPLDEVSTQFTTALAWRPIVTLVVLAALAAAALRSVRRQWLGLGFLVILATLIPHSTTLFNRSEQFVSWEFLYLPLAGFALLAGGAVDAILRPEGTSLFRRRAVTISAAAALALFTAVLVMNNVAARSPLSWWARVLSFNPKSAKANVAIGRMLLASGDEKNAMPRLFAGSLSRVGPSSSAAAKWYASRGEPLAAAIHLRFCIDVPGATFDETNDEIVALADTARALGATDWVEDCLGQLIARNPDDADFRATLAQLMTAKGYVRAARRMMERAVDLEPDRKDFRAALAEIDRRTHSIKPGDPVLVVTPQPPEYLQYAIGRPVPLWLRAEIIKLADDHPLDPIIQLEAAVQLAQDGNTELAYRHTVQASDQLRGFAYAWAVRCWFARELDNDDDALLAAVHVATLGPLEPAMAKNIYHNLGYLLDRKGLLKESAAYYIRALDVQETPDLHAAVAGVLLRMGRSEEAMRHLERAIEMGLDTANVENNLGHALLDLKRPDDALGHLKRAVEIDPSDVRTHRSLARAFMTMGRFAEAREAFEQGLRRFRDDEELSLGMTLLLSAAPDERLRDGMRAVRLADDACKKHRTPELLDALAAAYAEAKLFDDARKTEEEAIRLATGQRPSEALRIMSLHMRLYQSDKPLRFPTPGGRVPEP